MTTADRKNLATNLRNLAGRIEKGDDFAALKPDVRAIAEKLTEGLGIPAMMRGMLLSALK